MTTHDTEPDTSEPIAQMQREHAAMLAFIRKLLPDDLIDDAQDLLPYRNITFNLRAKNGEILNIWQALTNAAQPASGKVGAANAETLCRIHSIAFQQRFDGTWGCQLCDGLQGAAHAETGEA